MDTRWVVGLRLAHLLLNSCNIPESSEQKVCVYYRHSDKNATIKTSHSVQKADVCMSCGLSMSLCKNTYFLACIDRAQVFSPLFSSLCLTSDLPIAANWHVGDKVSFLLQHGSLQKCTRYTSCTILLNYTVHFLVWFDCFCYIALMRVVVQYKNVETQYTVCVTSRAICGYLCWG